jgi:DNA mismatch endonuclease (patch repair protein)
MPERLTPVERSRVMRAIRSRDTGPELLVRRLVHGLGYRFRLYRRDLPGTPDVVLPRHGRVIHVHGCFWHAHGCRRRKAPVNNAAFWRRKFAANVARDRRNLRRLRRAGWRVLTVWECQTRDVPRLTERLRKFLAS